MTDNFRGAGSSVQASCWWL